MHKLLLKQYSFLLLTAVKSYICKDQSETEVCILNPKVAVDLYYNSSYGCCIIKSLWTTVLHCIPDTNICADFRNEMVQGENVTIETISDVRPTTRSYGHLKGENFAYIYLYV